MADKSLAKVILHTDASVHIAIPSPELRTFYATVNNLITLMSTPLDYIKGGYEGAIESTYDLFGEKIPPYADCPGVVLCHVSKDKDLVCHFPELFSVVFGSISGELRDMPLNMGAFLDGSLSLSDAKTFLLQYYLSFVNSFRKGTTIRNKLDISPESFHAVLRQIFNTAFEFKPHEPPSADLATRVQKASYKQLFGELPTGGDDDLIPITEYCIRYEGTTRRDVHKMIDNQEIRFLKTTKGYLVDKFQAPTKKQSAANASPKVPAQALSTADDDYFSNARDWPAAKVKQFIIDNQLFSNEMAEYIYTREELSIYLLPEHNFREVIWSNIHFLIMPFDWDQVDEKGISNRQRMKSGKAPVVVHPSNPSRVESAELHHMGQRDRCYAATCPFLHERYYSIMHTSEPNKELHDAYFDLIKSQFWHEYYVQLEKVGWNFNAISHYFPNEKTNKGIK